MLDEESYLDIAQQLSVTRPYDWWRPWQPWGLDRTASAYVYAHPPLFLVWVQGWVRQGAALGAVKAAAALPWAMLFGWATGRLAERLTRQPWWAGVTVLTAPIALLGLQRGLMPDLLCAAMGALAMTCWVEAQDCPPGANGGFPRVRWLLLSGATLGAAAFTKYPALLLWVPLLAHALRTRRAPAMLWVGAGFAATWGAGEAWLWATYGRLHLLEVLLRADEIARGAAGGRALGVASRLGLLGVSALPALAGTGARRLPLALLGGCGLVVLGAPADTPALALALLAGLAGLGVFLVGSTVEGLGRSPHDRHDGDGVLLSSWALAVLAGVLIGHNYAAPRYLLPMMLPLGLLVCRAAERRPGGKLLLAAGVVGQLALGLLVTVAEHRFAHAQVEAAEEALDAVGPSATGVFSGEWTFRWRMQQAGWTWWDGAAPVPPGTPLVSATEAGPAAIPAEWEPVATVPARLGHVRVLDAAASVSLYSETGGVLPLGASQGPLEQAVVWTRP